MTGAALIGTWVTNQVVFNGVVQGLTIALVGLGIVLIFRSTKVINFAVGNMGLPAAALMAVMMINYELGFWLSLVVSLIVGAAFAAAVELIVVRRLFDAPRVILLVATIGVAQLAAAITFAFPDLLAVLCTAQNQLHYFSVRVVNCTTEFVQAFPTVPG